MFIWCQKVLLDLQFKEAQPKKTFISPVEDLVKHSSYKGADIMISESVIIISHIEGGN